MPDKHLAEFQQPERLVPLHLDQLRQQHHVLSVIQLSDLKLDRNPMQ